MFPPNDRDVPERNNIVDRDPARTPPNHAHATPQPRITTKSWSARRQRLWCCGSNSASKVADRSGRNAVVSILRYMLFTATDVQSAVLLDAGMMDRLTLRSSGVGTPGERAKLFVELCDHDTSSLDLEFVLGYLEVKALVELGSFLLPPPTTWPSPCPSCRPYVPHDEPDD